MGQAEFEGFFQDLRRQEQVFRNRIAQMLQIVFNVTRERNALRLENQRLQRMVLMLQVAQARQPGQISPRFRDYDRDDSGSDGEF